MSARAALSALWLRRLREHVEHSKATPSYTRPRQHVHELAAPQRIIKSRGGASSDAGAEFERMETLCFATARCLGFIVFTGVEILCRRIHLRAGLSYFPYWEGASCMIHSLGLQSAAKSVKFRDQHISRALDEAIPVVPRGERQSHPFKSGVSAISGVMSIWSKWYSMPY